MLFVIAHLVRLLVLLLLIFLNVVFAGTLILKQVHVERILE